MDLNIIKLTYFIILNVRALGAFHGNVSIPLKRQPKGQVRPNNMAAHLC